MKRYWLDTEFIEDERVIDLISIGIVCEDGREFYRQSCEFDPSKASDWVVENVLSHLGLCPWVAVAGNPNDLRKFIARELHVHEHGQCLDQQRGWVHNCPWRDRAHLQYEIKLFLDPDKHGIPEIWTYYGSYDWVVFCQIFGKMVDLPSGFPMYTRDIKQFCDMLGNPKLPEQGKD